MMQRWNVLVVDDDADIHDVTELALKRKSYRGRPFHLLHAASAAEARTVLSSSEGSTIHAALVDVVMENDRAGLELCEFIRAQMSDSLRIILRTGQAGAAPEEAVMNDYDIDTYLPKANLTAETLYSALRAACRSSLDVATATTFADQLRDYIEALQSSKTAVADLLQIMYRGLDFLEVKHAVQLAYIDVANDQTPRHGVDLARIRAALTEASGGANQVVAGESCGLSSNELLVVITGLRVAGVKQYGKKMMDRVSRWLLGSGSDRRVESVTGAIHANRADGLGPKQRSDLVRDLKRFMEGSRVAMLLLSLREQLVDERMIAIGDG
jgi:CheY-like chemotaxis protein